MSSGRQLFGDDKSAPPGSSVRQYTDGAIQVAPVYANLKGFTALQDLR
jgi:hypothetical protein